MPQVAIPQHFGDFRHTHRGTRMAGISLLNCVHGQGADGVGDGGKNGRSHVGYFLVADIAAGSQRIESCSLKGRNYQPNGTHLARHFLPAKQIFSPSDSPPPYAESSA